MPTKHNTFSSQVLRISYAAPWKLLLQFCEVIIVTDRRKGRPAGITRSCLLKGNLCCAGDFTDKCCRPSCG